MKESDNLSARWRQLPAILAHVEHSQCVERGTRLNSSNDPSSGLKVL